MSFSVDFQKENFYYSGTLTGIFSQKKNILKKKFWIMLYEIIKFYKSAHL